MNHAVLQTKPLNNGARSRVIAGSVLLGALALLATAVTLTPSPAGYGTHRQLGSPACVMPILTGYPCPTCGMTTAFAYAVRGQLVEAFHAQPAGLALALMVGAAVLCAVFVLVAGAQGIPRFKIHPIRTSLLVLGVILFGWAYKIMTFTL